MELNTRSRIRKTLADIKLAKLQLIADNLDGYQAVNAESFPEDDTFNEWLIRNQNSALGLGNPILADFHRPIEMEMLLLPNALM